MSTREPSKWTLYAAGVAFSVSIGFSFFGIKKCVPYGDTLTLLAYRYAAALIGVIIFTAVSRAIGTYPESKPGRPKGKLYMTAAFYILFMILQIFAMYFSTSIEGAIVYAMVPIFPMIIGEFIGVLGGSLIIESIFGVPGTGALYINSITALDYNFFLLLLV